ncbi:MAG TPA: hypothetical protein VE981_12030 [Planctomycetota bacterium]|nr:hypothetical protein [Planctomycetota bacterium]
MRDTSGGRVTPRYGDRTALVAHEDSHARKYLREALSRAGYTTEVCSDSGAILERLRTKRHSFVVLKNGDPQKDAVRTLREKGNRIPVILLSAAGPESPLPLNAGYGVVGHLSAPFTLESVRLAIAQVCHFDSPRPGPGLDHRRPE